MKSRRIKIRVMPTKGYVSIDHFTENDMPMYLSRKPVILRVSVASMKRIATICNFFNTGVWLASLQGNSSYLRGLSLRSYLCADGWEVSIDRELLNQAITNFKESETRHGQV